MAGETTRARNTSTPNPIRSDKICQLRAQRLASIIKSRAGGTNSLSHRSSAGRRRVVGRAPPRPLPGTPPSSDTNAGTAAACQKRGLGEVRRRRAERDPKAKCFLCSPFYGRRVVGLCWAESKPKGLWGNDGNGGKLRGSSRRGGWG